MTDEQLLIQLKDVNPAALETLIYRYHAPIYAYISRLVRNPHIAEDLTQECFTRICLAVRDGRLPVSIRPWIYRIATNLCKDLWKKASHRNEVPTDEQELSTKPDRDTVSSILIRQWEREEVISALAQLSEDSRQIVVLRYYQDLKLQEISEIVDMPLSTVKSKLYQALRKMARILEEKEVARSG
ncbi:RNA polymerase sigma factor [Cohnella sp. WQ 127256]|uniref:RNA polymerase sigma factor n=1 Tax=Cohnella sp. WQ 127256 TaxID=2938790 RepID=UPI002118EBE3|nr:RNA polymerase sigma factor [Cohnella sp. WQ 127256]